MLYALRDVTKILSINPKVIGIHHGAALPARTRRTDVANRQELFTIRVPLRQTKGMASGAVTRFDSKSIEARARQRWRPVFAAKAVRRSHFSSRQRRHRAARASFASKTRAPAAAEKKKTAPHKRHVAAGRNRHALWMRCGARRRTAKAGASAPISCQRLDVAVRHARIDVHGAVSVAAAAAAHNKQGHSAARARTAARAAAARLRQLVGLRHRLTAIVCARDPTARRRLLDDGGARRGAHAGRRNPANRTHHSAAAFAHARLLR